MADTTDSLDTELELIAASLLPEETLASSPATAASCPREISISNADSLRTLQIAVGAAYPSPAAVTVELKGNDIGRDDAARWKATIDEYMGSWDAAEDYPLYQLLTTHLLPLLAPSSTAAPGAPAPPAEEPRKQLPPQPPILHHALLTSHHLLSPTKRKNFLSLASRLSLTGFSKVGHPGIYYALGERDDVDEWVREVKSWNWLALRIRVGVEPLPAAGGTAQDAETGGRGKEDGARGGKGRGDWVELHKIGEALEWMRERGREDLLRDIGIGA